MTLGTTKHSTIYNPNLAEKLNKEFEEPSRQGMDDTAGGLSHSRTRESSDTSDITMHRSRDVVVWSCLLLGTICVLSSVCKTWLADPNSFDWFVLAMGVTLSGLCMLRRVAFGPKGFEAEVKHLRSEIQALKMSVDRQ